MELTLELAETHKSKTGHIVVEGRDSDGTPRSVVGVTSPMVDEDYWALRVKVSDTQAVLGFEKFGTIGIGFAQEEDWNTNLPWIASSREIFEHIKHNKGDDAIPDERVIVAIHMVREGAAKLLDGSICPRCNAGVVAGQPHLC